MAEEMLDALDRAGVRLTGPRRKLAALIERREGHFTAADLLKDAGRRRMGIGRATVFRLLELLSEQGLVERIDLPDGTQMWTTVGLKRSRAKRRAALVSRLNSTGSNSSAAALTAAPPNRRRSFLTA